MTGDRTLPARPTRLALAAALLLFAARASAEDLPADPDICLAPVPAGPTGGSDFGHYANTENPQFIPGYPTPIFEQRNGAFTYLDARGRLMPLDAASGPPYFGPVYLGRDGEIYYWGDNRDRQPRRAFDRNLGHFRDLRPDETARRAEVEHLIAEAAGYEKPFDAPSALTSGRHFPLRNQRATNDTDRPGFFEEPWWIDDPASGLRVEAEGDKLTLMREGRSRSYTLPDAAWGNWSLTDLPRSGRAVLHSMLAGRLLLIDADLRLTRPAGDWRLGRNPDVLFLPVTGEALITSSKALYWLRDTRLSGAGICGDTTPPPPQPMTLTDPPGAEVLAPHPGPGGYLPIRGGEAVLFTTWFGLFELGPDGVVRRIETVPPERFNTSYRDLRNGHVFINGCDHAIVFDGTRIVTDTGPIASRCTLDLRPLARNPATGTIWLEGGQRLTAAGDLLDPDGPHRPVEASDWLDAPLVGFALWGADDRLVPLAPDLDALYKDWKWAQPSDVDRFWTDIPRFRFLIGMRDGFVRFGPDLKLTPMLGQPGRYEDHAYDPIDMTFDPGSGAVLAGTRWDLLAITADGAMRRVPCRNGCDYGWIGALAPDPATPAGALVGTEAGLFRYDAAAGDITPLLPVERTGSIYGLRPVPWLAFTLIDAGFGTFTWSPAHGLRRIPGENGAVRPPPLVVIPEARRILTDHNGAPRLATFP